MHLELVSKHCQAQTSNFFSLLNRKKCIILATLSATFPKLPWVSLVYPGKKVFLLWYAELRYSVSVFPQCHAVSASENGSPESSAKIAPY